MLNDPVKPASSEVRRQVHLETIDFDYPLPSAAIAQTPAEPRDSARLLRVEDLSDHRFSELPDLLNARDLVVVNDTRVRAARLRGQRRVAGTGSDPQAGGRVEALLLEKRDDGTWEALVRPARKVRIGQEIDFGGLTAIVLTDPVEGRVVLRLDAPGDIEDVVAHHGEVPLPPYITRTLADPERYQTVYAATPGSAAAPTAGLHFTRAVLDRLESRGVSIASVELRVGVGTFRPITSEAVEDHKMHPEWVSVPEETAAAVAEARDRGGAVVAIGTTVVRALESRSMGGSLEAGSAYTDLFIRPGHRFRSVDRLVTNFHAPRSSLLVMLAAFMGSGWRLAYEVALRRGYRFLSFGDAMLVDHSAGSAGG